MLKVRLLSQNGVDKGEIECESIEIGCGCYHLVEVADVKGSVDMIDIIHHPQGGVSFAIDIMDIVSIKTV